MGRHVKELTYTIDEDKKNQEPCRLSLTSSRARSSPTRSRLRRPRRLPPSTLPSTDRSRTTCLSALRELTSTSRLWPRPELAVAPLDPCKSTCNMTSSCKLKNPILFSNYCSNCY